MTNKIIVLVSTGLLAVGAFGAQQTINLGTTANDGTGDPLRTAFGKANSNFVDLSTNLAAIQHGTNLNPTNTINGSGTSFLPYGIESLYSNGVRTAGFTTNGHGEVSMSGTNPVSLHTVGNPSSGIAFGLGGNSNNTAFVWQGTNVGQVGSNGFTGTANLTGQSIFASTNGVTPSWTIAGTNGNNYVYVNGSSAQFQTINIGDTFLVGTWQAFVSSFTNANQTLGVTTFVGTNWTSEPVVWFPAPVALNDTIPRRTGVITGGSGFGVSSFSIGNNGGVSGGYWFLDGAYSANILNEQGSGGPNFLGFSAGIGLGGANQNQFIIEDGSVFNCIVIDNTNNVGFRGSLYNNQTTNMTYLQPAVVPQVQSPLFQDVTPTPVVFSTGISGTNGNAFCVMSASAYSFSDIGDLIYVAGSYYLIVGKTNATKAVALGSTLALGSPIISGPFTNNPAGYVAQSPAFGRTFGFHNNGYLNIAGNNGGLGGIVIDDGVYSTYLGNESGTPDFFAISAGFPRGGVAINQFVIQPGGDFNQLILYGNNSVGIRNDLTNSQGGVLVMDNALNCSSNVAAPTIVITNFITIGGVKVSTGTGSPNGAVTGSVGDEFYRTDGGSGTTLYVKESGTATTSGWVGK